MEHKINKMSNLKKNILRALSGFLYNCTVIQFVMKFKVMHISI